MISADKINVEMLANEMTIVPTETLPVQKIKADITALKNFELFRIEEVTYEKTAPRKEALENSFW